MFKKVIVFASCLLVFACEKDIGKITYVEDLTTLKNTTSGQVIGFKHINNSLAWYGIPYAKPPIDELRWRAPQPIENRKETLDWYVKNYKFFKYFSKREFFKRLGLNE